MTFADFLPPQCDEASIALFALKHKFLKNDEQQFLNLIRIFKQKIQINPKSLLPIFLFYGLQKEKSIIRGITPRNFALSFIQTEIDIKGKKFGLMAMDRCNVVYPKPSEEEINVINELINDNGVRQNPFYFPESIEEFGRFLYDPSPALSWYQNIH